VGGRVNWKPLVGFISTGVDVALAEESCWERWEIRASSDIDVEASVSLFERSRPSEAGWGGTLSEVPTLAGVPADETSV